MRDGLYANGYTDAACHVRADQYDKKWLQGKTTMWGSVIWKGRENNMRVFGRAHGCHDQTMHPADRVHMN